MKLPIDLWSKSWNMVGNEIPAFYGKIELPRIKLIMWYNNLEIKISKYFWKLESLMFFFYIFVHKTFNSFYRPLNLTCVTNRYYLESFFMITCFYVAPLIDYSAFQQICISRKYTNTPLSSALIMEKVIKVSWCKVIYIPGVNNHKLQNQLLRFYYSLTIWY